MKPIAPLLALAVLAPLSAHAQPAPIWGGHYNMGVFAAGGGSEADGHVSLECSGDELADAGAFFLQLEPAASIEPFVDAPPHLDFLIDGDIFTVPVTAENGAVFFYRSEPEDDTVTLPLIAALRGGRTLVVSAPELDIAEIALRGSGEALTYVEQCVADND
ncbi:hypothetical protein [Devosia sp. Root635]|uniref:hypothetical protein n=1 Tax=Devosia sp. Root635 TaxID=1736575 RepID=UPI0006FCE503|nr:hypothetical protein [Devosia sp. Root635]KRA55415.1 hypothetical protein ASD80_13490 [Devosia sp. Root635]